MAKGKIAMGVVVGALIGVAAGILAAPRSGKETRLGIKAKAGKMKQTTARQVEAGKEKAADALHRLKDKE